MTSRPGQVRAQRDGRHFTVHYPANRNVASWSHRHSLGDVPDSWPYGLNRLGDTSTASWTSLPTASAPRRAALRLRFLALSTRRRGIADPGQVELTWDEYSALDFLAHHSQSTHWRATGVIWLTDMFAAQPSSLQVRSLIKALKAFDMLWCLARPQVNDISKALGDYPGQIEFIRFGIDTDFFASAPLPTSPAILSVGGDRDRDAKTLFEAVSHIHEQRPDVCIRVQTSSKLRPPEGVEVVPHLTHAELRNAYRDCSLVLVATKQNRHVSGMTVSLEAMAMGRPVLATYTDGFEDYLVDGLTGRFVDSGDGAALAQSALEILRDRRTLESMSTSAALYVRKHHTSAQMAERLASAVSRSISGSAPTATITP